MTVITIRISEKDKHTLERYGKISDVVRDAIQLYVNNKKSLESLKKLKEFQSKNPIATTTQELVSMFREDRENSDL